MTIKEAVFNYNGRKKLKDIEISHIKWFMRTQNLSVEEAVKAYFEDKEAEKDLTVSEYLSERKRICSEISSHCEGCRYKGICVKSTLLEQYALSEAKTVQRSECWKN